MWFSQFFALFALGHVDWNQNNEESITAITNLNAITEFNETCYFSTNELQTDQDKKVTNSTHLHKKARYYLPCQVHHI